MFQGRFLPSRLLLSTRGGGGPQPPQGTTNHEDDDGTNHNNNNRTSNTASKSFVRGRHHPPQQHQQQQKRRPPPPPPQNLSTTLAHLHRQQQQQHLSHNAAHALYSNRRRSNQNDIDDDEHDDDDDFNDHDNNRNGRDNTDTDNNTGYALEFDCGESVSSLNDSCFGGASVVEDRYHHHYTNSNTTTNNSSNNYNAKNDTANIFDPSTRIAMENDDMQQQQQQQSPMRLATSLVVGIVPSVSVSDHPSFDDTEEDSTSYFVHDVEQPYQHHHLLQPPSSSPTDEGHQPPGNDDDNNSRINTNNGRLRTMMPLLTGTLSPKQPKNRTKHTAGINYNNNRTTTKQTVPIIPSSTTMTTSESMGTTIQDQKIARLAQSQRQQLPPPHSGSMMISETAASSNESQDENDVDGPMIVEMTLPNTTTTVAKSNKNSTNHRTATTTTTQRDGGGCCWHYPQWFQRVPFWYRVIFIIAWMVLIVAIAIAMTVAIAVAVIRSNHNNYNGTTTPSSSLHDNNNQYSDNNNKSIDYNPTANGVSNIFVTTPTTTTMMTTTIPTITPTTIRRQKSDNKGDNNDSSSIVPSPTKVPTASPMTNQPQLQEEPVSFQIYITAGQYSEEMMADIQSSVVNIPNSNDDDDDTTTATFLVHLGDWNTISSCTDESAYQSIANVFSMSSIPVYFVMGENESTSCTDPMTSVSLWKKYLLDYDTQFTFSTIAWENNQRQGDPFSMYNENRLLTIHHNQMAFVTLNVVTDDNDDDDSTEVSFRHEANLQWIDTVYTTVTTSSPDDEESHGRTIVIFVNDGPKGSVRNTSFYTELLSRIETTYSAVHFMIVTRSTDETTTAYSYELQYDGISNLSILNVIASIWPPLQVTIDFDATSTNNASPPQVTLNDNSW